MRTTTTILLAILVTMATPAVAGDTFMPHEAEYKVKISVLGGKLNTSLKRSADGYVAHHVIRPTGVAGLIAGGTIDELSEFSIGTDSIKPSFYRTDDQISSDKERAEIRFDWSTGEASGQLNDKEVSQTLSELAHDRVSIQYQLMHDLSNGGARGTYILFEVDKLKTLNVTSIGSKKVKVPAGTYNAVGIQHQAEGSSRVTTLWCVEELGFLPVIIEQHKDGKLRLRATLKRYTAR
jgi:hypothetical protein